jgi:hypothetical protein
LTSLDNFVLNSECVLPLYTLFKTQSNSFVFFVLVARRKATIGRISYSF